VSTAVSRVTSQWEALPRHCGGGEERSVDLPVTVAAAALVTSPLAGEGMPCIARIRHNSMSNRMVALKAIPQNQIQNCFEGCTKYWGRCIASQGEYSEGDHNDIQQ
jgi:hypothetical protein